LVNRIGDDEGFSCSAALQGCVDGALIVTDENVLFDDAFFALIPVEVSGDHAVLNIALVVLIFLLWRGLNCLIPNLSKEGQGVLPLDLSISFCLGLHILFLCIFVLPNSELSLLACVFLYFFDDLFLVESEVVVYATICLA
jgi:hypothetical protein